MCANCVQQEIWRKTYAPTGKGTRLRMVASCARFARPRVISRSMGADGVRVCTVAYRQAFRMILQASAASTEGTPTGTIDKCTNARCGVGLDSPKNDVYARTACNRQYGEKHTHQQARVLACRWLRDSRVLEAYLAQDGSRWGSGLHVQMGFGSRTSVAYRQSMLL